MPTANTITHRLNKITEAKSQSTKFNSNTEI